MKRTVLLMLAALLSVVIGIPCFAAEFKNPPITDGAGYLSSEQYAELSEKLETVRKRYDFDVAIYTESVMSGSSAMESADDIFDYNGYGAGAECDGIILYISASPREYWMSTHADGLRVFTDIGIDYLKMQIQPHLAEDNYYEAINCFITHCDTFLEMAENGEPFNEYPTTIEYVIIILAIAIFTPLIIAKLMTSLKSIKMKTATANNYAENYINSEGMKLNASRDVFLYSTITKRPRPKENTSSGTHTSSSGRSHGGGGGSF